MDAGGHGAERAEVSRGGCWPAEQQEQHRHRQGRQGRLGGECADSTHDVCQEDLNLRKIRVVPSLLEILRGIFGSD